MKNRLIFVIFLIWAAVVIFKFNAVLPADFNRFSSALAAFPGMFNLKGASSFLLKALIEIFLAAFLFAVSYIIGRKITNTLKKDLDTAGHFVISSAAGFLVIAGFIFGISALGFLYEGVIFTAFIGLCFYALFDLKKNPSGIRFEPKKYDGEEICLLVITGFFMLTNLLLALTPETFFDSLEYHLAVPASYILNHGMVKMPYNVFSGFPGNAELLYLVGLVLNGEGTAKLINFLFGVLLLVSVYSFSKKYISRKAGLFAASLFCIIPLVAINLINTQVDVLSAFWFFISFYMIVNAAEKNFSGQAKTLALAGLFAGFGMGVKYSGIIYASGIVAVLIFYIIKNKALKRSPAVLSVFFFFALIPVVPWLIKNYLFFGNPFYPYFTSLPGAAKLLSEQTGLPLNNILDFVKLPWTLSIDWAKGVARPGASMNLGPALLAFLPFLLWPFLKKSKEKKPLLALFVFIAVVSLFWLGVTRIARFFIPGLIFLSLYFGYVITGYLKEEKDEHYSFTVFTVLALVAVSNFVWVSNINLRNMDPLALYSGKITGEMYLSTHRASYPNPYFKAVDFVNKFKTAPGSKVLFIGEGRAFYCKKPFIAGTVYDAVPFFEYVERAKREGGLKNVLKKENISLALINLREAKQHASYLNADLIKILQSREFSEAFEVVFNDINSDLYVCAVKK